MNKNFIKVLATTTVAISLMGMTADLSINQPQIVKAARASQKSVSMLVYKYSANHTSQQKSMARGFVGTKAHVVVKNGKITKLIVHVDGKNSPLGKGKNVESIVRNLKINGISGKKANITKNHSSFDFVFPAKAFQNGSWAKMKVTINFGGKMTEYAWIKFGKISGIKAAPTPKAKSVSHKKVSKKASH